MSLFDINFCNYGDGKMYDKLKSYYYNATNSNASEEQKDLTKILEL